MQSQPWGVRVLILANSGSSCIAPLASCSVPREFNVSKGASSGIRRLAARPITYLTTYRDEATLRITVAALDNFSACISRLPRNSLIRCRWHPARPVGISEENSLDISSRQQLVRHLACSYGHSLWGCYCKAVNGRNASGQGHSTVKIPVRNEGGRSVRLLIYTETPI
jgi:hypothetical protein